MLFFSVGNAVAKANALSDTQVKNEIIAESIADYPGVCACPFNQARNGSSCGRRSAWSKAGGYSPICYQNEVTAEMIKEWRERNS
ncbi:hypothetical protein B9Q19_16360 [Enterobacter bugandensis]|nr:hypothetical protein B9Q19_16360 [Enterobacter bugandensis]